MITINESDLSSLSITAGELQRNITYLDGLGREIQQIHRAHSFENKQDIITPIVYDAFGRQINTYLLYESVQSSGDYKTSAVSEQSSFFAPGTAKYAVARDSKPFGITAYENSPLNRVTASFGPGENWHTAGKKVRYEYMTNLGEK